MAGASAERQEMGLIKKINAAVKANKGNPITLVSADGTKIANVTGAKKFTGRQASGSEPYTDVVITIGKKNSINISMKGEAAPSLAGGGMRGINMAAPGLAAKFMKAVYTYLVKKAKINPGDKVPDVFGKIPPRIVKTIIIGNVQMGGPIDYMYIGPMDVSGIYNKNTNTLPLNGSFTEAAKYAKKYDFYFRLRARREDQRFDPNAKDSDGVPKIYGKSPSRGDSAGRMVIISEDTLPRNAATVDIE
jgi:hypothetical protein